MFMMWYEKFDHFMYEIIQRSVYYEIYLNSLYYNVALH